MNVIRQIMQVEDAEMQKNKWVSGILNAPLSSKILMQEPSAYICLEDFDLGTTDRLGFYHDEFQIVLKGKAEYTVVNPLYEEQKVILEPGDACFIYRGDQVRFNILEAPFRHLCVIMPTVPLHTHDHLTKMSYDAHKATKAKSRRKGTV